jgi:hypothetical protein
MIRALASFVLGCSVALLAAHAGAADLTIVSKATGDGGPETRMAYMTAEKIRVASAHGQEFMVDGAKGEFTMIDNGKKEYSVTTKQEFQDAMAQMSQKMQEAQQQMAAAQAKMQEQMKNMPPEMREKLKSMQGGMFGAIAQMIEVKKGTGHRTIAGYGCDEWIVTMGQLSKTEECLSTEVPISLESWQTYRDFAGSFGAMGAGGQGMRDLQEKMKQLKGIPLSHTTTTSIMGKTTTDTSEVTEIRKGVPPNAFDLPAGYKKVESPMVKMAKSMNSSKK